MDGIVISLQLAIIGTLLGFIYIYDRLGDIRNELRKGK